MIDNILKESYYFTTEIIQQCKRNANIPPFITKYNNNIIKGIALKFGLYSQVVIIHSFILKTKITKKASVKDKYNNNESAMNSQNEDDNDKECASVKEKTKKRPSEAIEERKNKS